MTQHQDDSRNGAQNQHFGYPLSGPDGTPDGEKPADPGPRPTVQCRFLDPDDLDDVMRKTLGITSDDRLGFGKVPRELKDRPQWCVWRYALNREGTAWTKQPYRSCAPNRLASTTDGRTWSTFDDAERTFYAHKDRQGEDRVDGIGYIFAADDPYVGIDLDRSLHGVGQGMKPWGHDALDALNSYTEVSPSGTGVKVIAKADPPETKGRKKNRADGDGAVEMYSRERFFTITGDGLDRWSESIEERTEAVAEFHRLTFGEAAKGAKEARPAPGPIDASDGEILGLAFASKKNGREIEALMGGDTSRHGGDDSAADLALCSHLAFWFRGDAGAIDRVFRTSGLYREKWDRPDYRERTIAKALEGVTEFYEPGKRPKPKQKSKEEAPRPAVPAGGGYILGRSDVPVSCVSNSKAWLEDNRPPGHVRYDSFRRTILIGGEPLTDRAIVDLTLEIEESLAVPWCQDHVRSAVTHLAHKYEFSSLADYMESLAWDGINRIEHFFIDHFGVEDTPYHREVARVFFLSGAARALRPGCKVDTTPLLIGGQGLGKSTAAAALCPDREWFTDQLNGDMGSKEASGDIRGKFVVELSELSAMRRSELDAIKSFLSREVDNYRPPYGRVTEPFKRTCVFVGSTNEEKPLQDTENRRFHPIYVADIKVDVAAIESARDQLWAEAVHRFRAGEKHWTTSSHLEDEIRREGVTARSVDAWEDILAGALAATDRVTVLEAARHLNLPIERLGKSEQTRIGIAFKALGFKRDPKANRSRNPYYERDPSHPEV